MAAVASQVLNVYLRAVSVELKITRAARDNREARGALETLLEQQKGERRGA